MSMEILQLGLDVLIIVLLLATIYYGMVLSRRLNRFRSYREEFQSLIAELTRNIDLAYGAVENLKRAGKNTEGRVVKTGEASEELVLRLEKITKAGAHLADRLERLAEENRQMVSHDDDLFEGTDDEDAEERAVYHAERAAFLVYDRDKEDNPKKAAKPQIEEAEFLSQAERDLYNALKDKDKRSAN